MSEITRVRGKGNDGVEREWRLDELVTYGSDTVERRIEEFQIKSSMIKARLIVGSKGEFFWFSVNDLKKVKRVEIGQAMRAAQMWDEISRLDDVEVSKRMDKYDTCKIHGFTLWEVIEIGYLAERAQRLGTLKGWIVE